MTLRKILDDHCRYGLHDKSILAIKELFKGAVPQTHYFTQVYHCDCCKETLRNMEKL